MKIFNPIQIGRRIDIRVQIWKEQRTFKPFSLKLFLELLSDMGSQWIASTQAANIAVFNLLKNTDIELVWSIKSSLKLAFRTQSLEKIIGFHGCAQHLPSFETIESKKVVIEKIFTRVNPK